MASTSKEPLVSILCTAYQHGKFIRDTLDSFVSQRTNFPYEAIIHDDASSDDTAAIIREFEEKYPHIIKGIYQTENQHSKANGSVARILYSAARGKYIALCEGDDHWIDKEKLQRQIDALDSNDKAIGCFTDAYNERNGSRERFMAGYALAPKDVVDQRAIIIGQGIPTCTFIFKNIELKTFYNAREKAPVGDALLFTYLTNYGYFIYQTEITGVRIIHPGGIYSTRSAVHKLRTHLCALPFMDQLSHHKYSDILAERRRKALNIAWSEAVTTNNRELAKYVWPMIRKERNWYGWNLTTTIRNFFKANWPLPDKIWAKLTGK